MGFDAFKIKIGGGPVEKDLEAVGFARDVIGPDGRLMVDYNQSLSAPEARRRIAILAERHRLDWVEEPVGAEDFAGHRTVRVHSPVPIQSGENWWMPDDAARAMEAGISDHAMLDIMKIGGITGWMQAAAMALSHSMPVPATSSWRRARMLLRPRPTGTSSSISTRQAPSRSAPGSMWPSERSPYCLPRLFLQFYPLPFLQFYPLP